ncbi:MAG: Lrp/AsnC family transcriptional regulator [Anaerolineales bacterium]|nr:Lrp/AsnC family transcriptional regulator [Anaerolineales bacterium]
MNLPESPENLHLDSIDWYIIQRLRQDGRTPFSQIAQELSVSPGMIRLRYNRLVEKGYLQIVAITNPLNIGYHAVALIGIRVEGNKILKVAEEIAKLDEVDYLIITSGRFDLFAEVICRDRDELFAFLTEKLYQIEGVRESETFMHLKIVKEIYI